MPASMQRQFKHPPMLTSLHDYEERWIFQPTTLGYIIVLPSGLSTGSIAPWALSNPSWITAVSRRIHQLRIVGQGEGMTVRGLRLPVLTIQTTFSPPLKTIVVPTIATDTLVDPFSFCVGDNILL